MGVAAAQGLPLDVAAGAVISGAIFGDKMSPCSDTTVLAALSTRTNLYTHIRHMFYTTGGATLLCLCVYGFAGFSLTAVGGIGESGTLLADLEAIYDFSWLLLLPAILVLAGSVLKKPTIPIIIASSFLALFQGVVLQGFSVKTAVNAYVKGFSLSMLTTQVPLGSRELMARLLNRGGMESMLPICVCRHLQQGGLFDNHTGKSVQTYAFAGLAHCCDGCCLTLGLSGNRQHLFVDLAARRTFWSAVSENEPGVGESVENS